MPLSAYQRARQVSETPRSTEHRLLGEITAGLMQARDQGLAGPALMDVLHRNREVWQAFAADCGLPGNGLPAQLRASIMSIALWVDRHISLVMAGREDLEPLIDVNRLVMQGLEGEARAGVRAA
ncbi:MAG: flagellar biosynthesis regulator FlaF [Sandaracinobacter sp.]